MEVQKQKRLKKQFREALDTVREQRDEANRQLGIALETIKQLTPDMGLKIYRTGSPVKKVPVNITVENGGTLCIKS